MWLYDRQRLLQSLERSKYYAGLRDFIVGHNIIPAVHFRTVLTYLGLVLGLTLGLGLRLGLGLALGLGLRLGLRLGLG